MKQAHLGFLAAFAFFAFSCQSGAAHAAESSGVVEKLFIPGGIGAVPRTFQDKAQEHVSVKDFGAKCNGAGNDAPAVQKAVNYALTFDPPAVLEVPGLCRLDASVTIDRGIDAANASTFFIIRGQGAGAGFYAYNGVTMFTATRASGSHVPVSQKIHFDGITFKSEFPSNPTYALDDNKFMRVRFTNVSFHRMRVLNATGYLQSYHFSNSTVYGWLGTFLSGTNGAYDIKIDTMMAEAGGTFLSLVSNNVYTPDPVTGSTVTNSLIQGLTADAIVVDKAQGFAVTNNFFEGNGGVDLKFDTARNLANQTPNGAIVVTGNLFAPTVAHYTNVNYYPVRWGRVANGFAAGNYITQGARLHYRIPESRTTIIGDKGMIAALSTDEFAFAAGGYVQPGAGGERLRMVRGSVSSAGTITAGAGFTVSKTGTGAYTINITSAFGAAPSIVATPFDSNGTSVVALGSATTTKAALRFRNASNAMVDTGFQFVIIGPAE